MSLLREVLRFCQNNPLKQKLDQNFLIDDKIIADLVKAAEIKKEETILEIGPGLGFLTRFLASKAKKVIGVEIDTRFEPYLKKLPKNTKIIYGDIYKLLCEKNFILKIGKIDKIISNPPYSKIENILHPLMKKDKYRSDLFLVVPLSFISKINKNPIFSAYFEAIFIKKIPKDAFYPPPKTSSGIVYLKRLLPNRIDLFIRRFLYQHEKWKLKNALREAIIEVAKVFQKRFVSKNQAREIISKMSIDNKELEKQIYQIKSETYYLVSEKIIADLFI